MDMKWTRGGLSDDQKGQIHNECPVILFVANANKNSMAHSVFVPEVFSHIW